MEFGLVIGIGINVFTLFQLIRNGRWGVQANNIAIAIVVLWILRFLISYLRTQGYVVLYFFHKNFFLLDGVLLWLYAKSLLQKVRFSYKIILHFIPFLIFSVMILLHVVLTPQKELVEQYQLREQEFLNNELSIHGMTLLFTSVFIAASVIYFFKSLKEIRQYNQVFFANFSNLKNLSASWIINFLRLWMLLFLIPFLFFFLNSLSPIVDLQSSSQTVLSLSLLFSFLFNSNILNQNYLPIYIKKDIPDKTTIVVKKQFNETQFQKIKESLDREKYYKDENLSLHKLATHLTMKPTELTRLIKASEYNNFYDLINSYRIEAIKKELLVSSEQIMVIAYRNGFNSKSAFNRIFKNTTGQTPSEYRKSQNKSF